MMKPLSIAGLMLAAGLAVAGPARADVKIGIAGPITGPNAVFGGTLQKGVQQAIDDINAKGGVLGQKLAIAVGDDAADPRQAVSVANKFVGDGVTLVVGHFNSGTTIPASEVYAENNILFVTPAATSPKLTERGLWNAFRTCGRDDQQGRMWVDYATAHFKGKKIALVHDKTTYGQGLVDTARAQLKAAGIQEVLYEGINTGEKDYAALISKLKASGADILMWGGLHTEGGLIVRQMREQGLSTVMMSGDGITNDEFATIGGDGVAGTLMSFGPDPRRNPAAAAVVAAFRAGNFEPQGYTLYAYAAVQIMAQAAEAAKSFDTRKVAEVMHSGMAFKTVLGDISYDGKGDRTTLDYVMYTWRPGPDGRVSYFQD